MINHRACFSSCLSLSLSWMMKPWPPCWQILSPVHLMMKMVPLDQTAHKHLATWADVIEVTMDTAYKARILYHYWRFQGWVTSYNNFLIILYIFLWTILELQVTLCHHPASNWQELVLHELKEAVHFLQSQVQLPSREVKCYEMYYPER